jgi:beta-ketodecanoyl-[acyl-carrier-protein] synthase
MHRAVLSTTGLFIPPHTISNDELVASFNTWADAWNAEHADAIAAGEVTAKTYSSSAFIEKASGIQSRYVMDKQGILDPDIMAPRLAERSNDQLSIMAEMGVAAATQALERAGRSVDDIDAVICAASNMQRAYPAVSIEIQDALGIKGFAFDMNVACSSATFGIQTAASLVQTGQARAVLVINPEICSGHLAFTDRDCHFIFGDVATATLIERDTQAPADHWKILGSHLKTIYSNNIRNNFGFLNNAAPEHKNSRDKLFVQEGRKVFKQVIPMVGEVITTHLDMLSLDSTDIKRLWLHQANAAMNRLITAHVMGREREEDVSPTVLNEFANTSSAGSIIAFHRHSDDLKSGDIGCICSFGAGYSAGTVFVQRA